MGVYVWTLWAWFCIPVFHSTIPFQRIQTPSLEAALRFRSVALYLARENSNRCMQMSAEPGRKAPYANDLRWRIIWQRLGMEHTFRQVSGSLNIAIGTVYNIFRRFESTGNVQPTRPDRTSTRLLSEHDELLVMGIITANPTLYLREVCQKVFEATNIVVSASTICRILFRNGLTRKSTTNSRTEIFSV